MGESNQGEARDWATPGFGLFSTEQHGRTEDGPPSQSDRTESKNTYVLYDDRGHIIYLYMKNILYVEQESVTQYRK